MKLSGLHEEIPVFIDTNLGTHLALSIPPHITAGDLKRKLVQEHLSCLANLGEIKVQALMVKRRHHFYHLPDAMPIESAFQGYSGTWFLQMHASRLQDVPQPKTSLPSTVKHTEIGSVQRKLSLKCTKHCKDQTTQVRENQPSVSSDSNITDCSESEIIINPGDNNSSSIGNEEQAEVLCVPTLAKKSSRGNIAEDTSKKTAPATDTCILESFSGINPARKKKVEGNTTVNNQNSMSKEAPSLNVSKEISVTSIISRYFCDFDEVNSCRKLCEHKSEETHNNETMCSTMRASEHSVNLTRPKRKVESDTDTLWSISNEIISDVKQFKVTTDVSKARREAKRSCRKTKKDTGSEVRKRARRSRSMIPTPSDKLQVGKKLVQAANNISIYGSRRKLSEPLFVSRCGNFAAPESSVLVRNLAFEIDELDD